MVGNSAQRKSGKNSENQNQGGWTVAPVKPPQYNSTNYPYVEIVEAPAVVKRVAITFPRNGYFEFAMKDGMDVAAIDATGGSGQSSRMFLTAAARQDPAWNDVKDYVVSNVNFLPQRGGLGLTLTTKPAPRPLSAYELYLRDYSMYVKYVTGADHTAGSKPLRQDLAEKRNEVKAQKKEDHKAKVSQAAPAAAPDPESKNSKRKAAAKEKKAQVAAENATRAKANAEAAARKKALLEEKRAVHEEKIAELTATRELQRIENSVASIAAKRASKIRRADPSVEVGLDIEGGWKLVTRSRRSKTWSTEKTGTRASDNGGEFSTKITKTLVFGAVS